MQTDKQTKTNCVQGAPNRIFPPITLIFGLKQYFIHILRIGAKVISIIITITNSRTLVESSSYSICPFFNYPDTLLKQSPFTIARSHLSKIKYSQLKPREFTEADYDRGSTEHGAAQNTAQQSTRHSTEHATVQHSQTHSPSLIRLAGLGH